MDGNPVEFSVAGGVADIRFNRGDKHNSLTLEMFEAIAAAGAALREDNAIRVAVLSGNGPSFCAGLDVRLEEALSVGLDKCYFHCPARLAETSCL